MNDQIPWTPPPRERRGFDRRLLWAGLAVVVVFVVAVAMVVVVVRSDESAASRPDTLLAGTYPRQPTAAWSVPADELLPGSTVSTTETQILGAFGQRGFVDAGNRIIVRVVAGVSHDTAKLAAIDTETGQVDWAIPFAATSGCSPRPLGPLLPCILDKEVVFISLSDGQIASRYTPDFDPADVTSDGATIVVAGHVKHEPQTVTYDSVITSGTVTNPTEHWTTKLSPAPCHHGNSDNLDVVVKDGFVGMDLGMPDAALRLSDGSPLVDDPARLIAVYPRLGAAVQRCAAEQDIGTYFGPDPRMYRKGPLPITPSLWVTALPNPPVLTRQGDAIDFETGDHRWSLPDFRNRSDAVGVVGDVAVNASRDTVTAYDLRTGQRLWTVGSPDTYWVPVLTDGDRVMGASAGQIVAMSLTDGSTAWTRDVPVVGDDYAVIGAADAGLVAMTGDSVSLYPATGERSHVPGEINPAP